MQPASTKDKPRIGLPSHTQNDTSFGGNDDLARKALRNFNLKIKPALAAYARALTGNPKVKVMPHGSMSATDGQNIYVRVTPIMAESHEHRLRDCGKRDHTGHNICPACEAMEDVIVTIYHEIGHIVYDSFQKMSDREALAAIESAVAEMEKYGLPPKRIARIRKRLEDNRPSTFVEAAAVVSPFMPMLTNAVEDARVNSLIMERNPGMRVMFSVRERDIFDNGVRQTDGSVTRWSDAPLNSQAIIGVLLLASGYEIEDGWLDPKVAADISDPDFVALCERATDTESAAESYALCFPILEKLREMGYCQPEHAGEDPDEGNLGDDGGDGEQDPDDETADGSASDDARDGDDPDPSDDPDDDATGGSGDEEAADGDPGDEDADPDDDAAEGSAVDGDADGDSDPDEDADGESAEGEGEGDGGDGDDSEGEGGTGDDDSPADNWGDADGDGGMSGESDDPDADTKLGDDDEDPDDVPGQGRTEGAGSEAADDGDQSRPDSDGDDPDQGVANDEPSQGWGDPSDVQEYLAVFGEHEDELDEDQPVPDDSHEVERAINQEEHFDKPSDNLTRVNIVDDPDRLRDMDGYGRRALNLNGGWDSLPVAEATIQQNLGPIRAAFTENRRAKVDRNRRSGRINPAVLARRVPVEDDRLFRKKTVPGKRDYHVVIGLDVSGSTAQLERIQMIKAAAMAQADLLTRIGVSFEVWAHTAYFAGTPGRNMYEDWSLDLINVKSAKQPWNDAAKSRLQMLAPMQGNLDGHNMEFYRKRADESQASDKIIMYYTDGAMPAANYDEEREILERECRVAKQKGYEIVGVGVHTDSPTEYGLPTVQINSPEDVRLVVDELRRRLG